MILDISSFKMKAFLAFLFCLQVFMWSKTTYILPKLRIVPEVPSFNQARAMAFGDEQLYFRYLALYIQNCGDSFGRFTALKHYDYKLLLKWMLLLDKLDSKSNFTPAIASYYYSNTQNIADVRYIIEYLDQHYDLNPRTKWWWLSQATTIAQSKLKDKRLALSLAYKLTNAPAEDIPIWARQMPAFILEELGDKEQAMLIIKDVATRYRSYSKLELDFMNYFIRERLGFLNEIIK